MLHLLSCSSLPSDSEVYAGSKKATPMTTFLFHVSPDAQTVQLKDINHKYLAQVS